MHLIGPQGYLDIVKLQENARLALTDSAGIAEETTALQVPCLTLRENTERPVTIEQGSNQLVGCQPQRVVEAARALRWQTGPMRIQCHRDGMDAAPNALSTSCAKALRGDSATGRPWPKRLYLQPNDVDCDE